MKKIKTSPILRYAREQAHLAFDVLWKEKYMTRKEAYIWLSTVFNIPLRKCHISLFTINQCNAVKRISIKKIKNIKRLERKNKCAME